MAAHVLASSITLLINKSLESGKFPTPLKLAEVFLFFEDGSKADPSNYRSISVLRTISNIFEKHVNNHLMEFLNKFKLIHRNQSGFRQKYSCQTALVKLKDHWMKCIGQEDITGTLFVDFPKAFDVLDHDILLKNFAYTNLVQKLFNGLSLI